MKLRTCNSLILTAFIAIGSCIPSLHAAGKKNTISSIETSKAAVTNPFKNMKFKNSFWKAFLTVVAATPFLTSNYVMQKVLEKSNRNHETALIFSFWLNLRAIRIFKPF